MATIEDLLNALDLKKTVKMNPEEFWNRIASGESWDKMGFDTKEEFEIYMQENPYSDI